MQVCFQYCAKPLLRCNEVGPRKWCIKESKYLVGECPAMSVFLQWCLDQQYSNITWDMLKAAKAEDLKVAMSDIAEGVMECLARKLW